MIAKIADRRRDGGFTLIELLVVIVILVALAAIAIPVFLNQQEKADNAADTATVASLASFIAQGIADGSLASGSDPMTSNSGKMAKNGATVNGVDVATGTFCVSKGGFKYSNTTGAVVSGSC